jgi:hypothetical protein
MHDLMTRFDRELDDLRERAAEEVTYEIVSKLKDLGRRYPRHSFGLIDGMGVSVVSIDPPFLGEPLWHYTDFNWAQHPETIMGNFFTTFDEIMTLLDWLNDNFKITIGIIPLQVEN